MRSAAPDYDIRKELLISKEYYRIIQGYLQIGKLIGINRI